MNIRRGLTLTDVEELAVERVTDFSPVIIDGYVQAPPIETITIKGNIQPAPAKDIKQLPEGDTLTDVRKIWSNSEIKKRDIIIQDGKRYSVLKIFDWTVPTFTILHFSALIIGEEVSFADSN